MNDEEYYKRRLNEVLLENRRLKEEIRHLKNDVTRARSKSSYRDDDY